MIRVAFWFDRPIAYTGGLNYIKNLLYAVSQVNSGRIDPYVFFSAGIEDGLAAQFAPLATVVRTPVLERMNFWWYVDRVLYKLFGSQLLVRRELAKYAVRVVSHSRRGLRYRRTVPGDFVDSGFPISAFARTVPRNRHGCRDPQDPPFDRKIGCDHSE